jgi:hypothetical protein
MGAAMAPAAHDTITAHFNDLAAKPGDYDMIITGDLGSVGAEILTELLARDGFDVFGRYNDCGLMVYDRETQDVHAGGSGCGCAAAVLSARIILEPRAVRGDRSDDVCHDGTAGRIYTGHMLRGDAVERPKNTLRR